MREPGFYWVRVAPWPELIVSQLTRVNNGRQWWQHAGSDQEDIGEDPDVVVIAGPLVPPTVPVKS